MPKRNGAAQQKTSTLGERVRERREKLGLTQEALAGMVGWQKSAISHVEYGRMRPGIYKLPDLARALDCTVDFLLTGT